jgi:hypothetical protein
MATNKVPKYIISDEAEAAIALEARLDAALADTFPASDPVAITVTTSYVDEFPR